MVSKACLVGIYQRKLEEMAAQDEVELTVAVPAEWRDPASNVTLERVYTSGYELLVEPMAFNGNFHLHFYPRLGRLIRAIRPDIVHMDEEPYNLATYHGMVLARRAGCATLWFSWQNLHRRYPPPFSLMERYCLRRADAAIVGNHTAEIVWREKGYAGPVAVIPQFGVDPELFAPPAETPRYPGLQVGFAGRLVSEKGCDILLAAAAEVDEAHIQVLGKGPKRPQLAAQARQLGIEGRVSFRDPIPSTQMPSFYRQLDALVLPSRSRPNWIEQFGRVLIEAMACGVPVIGSDCGEIPHVVGDAGLIFPEDDVAALRDHLVRLAADTALRADLARRGRERVLKHYTQEQIAAQTVNVYRGILS
jgi:glycosyltransferase involved in cell wall biosynthesis